MRGGEGRINRESSTDIHTLPCSPGGSDGKASACSAGDLGSIPGSGRSAGEGNGNPVQYSCLENSVDRGAWCATVSPWGCKESDTTERLHSLHMCKIDS